jgi:hypothetical protein
MRHGKKVYKRAPRKQARQTITPRLIPSVKGEMMTQTRPVKPGKREAM